MICGLGLGSLVVLEALVEVWSEEDVYLRSLDLSVISWEFLPCFCHDGADMEVFWKKSEQERSKEGGEELAAWEGVKGRRVAVAAAVLAVLWDLISEFLS